MVFKCHSRCNKNWKCYVENKNRITAVAAMQDSKYKIHLHVSPEDVPGRVGYTEKFLTWYEKSETYDIHKIDLYVYEGSILRQQEQLKGANTAKGLQGKLLFCNQFL